MSGAVELKKGRAEAKTMGFSKGVLHQAFVTLIVAFLSFFAFSSVARPADQSNFSAATPLITINSTNSFVNSKTNLALRTISPGVFELGSVRIDKQQRTVRFPAKLNMNKGLMEYFLVADYGKTHESVLRTEVAPYQIHVAMLLLGVKGSTNQSNVIPQATITNPSKTALSGDKISLAVSWTADGKEIQRPAEELIFNREANSVMKPGGWVYNGSFLVGGTFLAQREGSIASLVTDSSALINYTGPGHDNDHIWTLNTNSLPPFDIPVQVTVQLDHSF